MKNELNRAISKLDSVLNKIPLAYQSILFLDLREVKLILENLDKELAEFVINVELDNAKLNKKIAELITQLDDK